MNRDLTLGQGAVYISGVCYYLTEGENSLDLVPEDTGVSGRPMFTVSPLGDSDCPVKTLKPIRRVG